MSAERIDDSDPDMELVRDHACKLVEHFDSVQIFCTKASDDGTARTKCFTIGRGNWYATYGLVHAWLAEKDQEARSEVMEDEE